MSDTSTTKTWFDPGQLNAVGRHVMTSTATVFSVLGILGILPADKAQIVLMRMQDIATHLQAIFGDLTVIWAVAGPIAVVWIAKAAAGAASLKSQLRSVTSNPQVEVQGKIVVDDPALAAAVPSPKVVAPGDNLARDTSVKNRGI